MSKTSIERLNNGDLQQYCEQYSSEPSTNLKNLERASYLSQQMPHMISGTLQGRLLSQFSHMMRPDRILEIGTFTGYATLCLAEGLSEHGKIITIESDEEKEEICQRFFDSSAYAKQIELKIGPAIDILPKLNDTFDLVFIDADKVNYLNYLQLILPKVRTGGIILADNVLFNGEVLDVKKSKNAAAMDAFNLYVHAQKDLKTLILPLRDGLSIIRKK